jgi:phage terminase large subunit GpA-like protein
VIATELANGRSEFAHAVARACRPRQRLTVSQWADAHRVLSAKGSSEFGQWRTSRTPYLQEPMDSLSITSPVSRVVMMFCAQVGKTEAGLNWIAYVMEHAPSPMLVVVPTMEVRQRWVRQRLNPMLTETQALADLFDVRRKRDSSNTESIKDYPGGLLVLGGANSPASLASMPIQYVLCDEVDRFPWEAGKEGDPLGLIAERQKTFPNRKTLLVSTPTIKGASRIEDEYENSDKRRYHVPCPECGDMQPFEWKQLGWDKELTTAWYACRACGAAIDETHKTRMLHHGEWIPENPQHPTRGYHLNGLYSPVGLGYSWIELAREWVQIQGDHGKLKRFVNTTLGETWEDRSSSVKPHHLQQRAESYKLRTVPPGCLVLTAGVDTQDDRLEVQILGWGRGEVCWVLDYLVITGNPGRPETWMKLSELLNTPLDNAFGNEMRIQATAVDTGGHYTHEAYQYVRSNPAKRVIAIKGKSTPGGPILAGRPSHVDVNWRGKVIKKGVKLWSVATDTAKHTLFARLKSDQDQTEDQRLIHFSEQLDDDYYKGLTAEAFDPEKNKWVLRRGRRNEPIDTWVYGTAAAHHPEIRVHAMRKRDWDRLAHRLEGQQPESAAPQQPAQTPTQRKRKRRNNGGGFGSSEWSL